MAQETQITAESPDSGKPYAHLLPIVNRLIELGNEPVRKDVFYLSQDGWRCDLKKPIDFQVIRQEFLLPNSIVLAEKNDSIWCEKSWIEIQGGWGEASAK
jgi:hypothetical protein